MNRVCDRQNRKLVVFSVLLLPFLILSAIGRIPRETVDSTQSGTVPVQTEITETILPKTEPIRLSPIAEPLPWKPKPAEAQPVQKLTEPAPMPILIRVLVDGQPVRMDLETYLVGVVLAEMPARFSIEALKAQAVAARTYTLKNCIAGYKHDPGTVCTRSSCCQAYKPVETYLADGGKAASVNKVKQAVQSTAGLVLMYEGKLIDAAYFSCSGGATEAAVEVWGYDVPYLQSVESPGEENAAAYLRETIYTVDEFCDRLDIVPSGLPENWICNVEYTEGGGVLSMTICGKQLKGTKLRSLLDLRSTRFRIRITEDQVTITTLGYGHRVGMSQYGANAMAAMGCTFQQILSHYYLGAVLSQHQWVQK